MFGLKNDQNNTNIRKSSNPTLSYKTFIGLENTTGEIMTLEGTVNKTFILALLTIISACFVWFKAENFLIFLIPIIIINLIISLIIIFVKTSSPYLTPIYAILEGILIGVISSFAEREFPGIVLQAVLLTFGVFLSILLAYKTGIIRATENFKLGIIAATLGIFFTYLISLIGMATGLYNLSFIHDSGIAGIIFSLFVVGIAAFNFVIDFDFIEEGVRQNAPKYMEWYGAFSLLVTLIWLYLEVLRLLSKARD